MKVFCLMLLFALMMPAICAAQKKNARYYFEQGEAALEESKYPMALAHFNECLRMDPYFWEAYRSRGTTREALGDSKGALTDYNIYVDSQPEDPEAMVSRAVLRYQLGQYLPAKADFLKLMTLPHKETNKVFYRQDSEGTNKMFTLRGTNHAEFLNYLGLIETRLKNYPGALIYLDSAIHLSGDDAQYLINRGILKEHLQDTSGAIADYEKALRLDPGSGIAMHNMAVIKRSRGEQATSETLLDDAIVQSPSLPYPYSARAYYRYTHKDLNGALEDYNKVIQLSKGDEESWLYRGMVKEKMKDFDGAFVDYTEAISLKNDFARAWLARGTLLTKLNRLPEAIEDYTVAILWNPESGIAYYNRGLAKQKTGKLKEACEDFINAERFNIKVEASIKSKSCF